MVFQKKYRFPEQENGMYNQTQIAGPFPFAGITLIRWLRVVLSRTLR